MSSSTSTLNEQLAMFVLRTGLGAFLLLWAMLKLLDENSAVKIFAFFYRIPLSGFAVYGAAVIEAGIAILILAGAWKRFSYALGLGLHAISTIASWKQLITPFAPGHDLFLAAIPVLGAFIALYLLRDRDTLWLLDDLRS